MLRLGKVGVSQCETSWSYLKRAVLLSIASVSARQSCLSQCCSRPRYPTSPFQPSACFHQSSVMLSTPYTLFGGTALVERTTRRKVVSRVETGLCWPFIISVSARQSVSACQSELLLVSACRSVLFRRTFCDRCPHLEAEKIVTSGGLRRECVSKRRRIGQVLDEPNSAILI